MASPSLRLLTYAPQPIRTIPRSFSEVTATLQKLTNARSPRYLSPPSIRIRKLPPHLRSTCSHAQVKMNEPGGLPPASSHAIPTGRGTHAEVVGVHWSGDDDYSRLMTGTYAQTCLKSPRDDRPGAQKKLKNSGARRWVKNKTRYAHDCEDHARENEHFRQQSILWCSTQLLDSKTLQRKRLNDRFPKR
jgi:hypothetical protein